MMPTDHLTRLLHVIVVLATPCIKTRICKREASECVGEWVGGWVGGWMALVRGVPKGGIQPELTSLAFMLAMGPWSA
jgi:hypothetical protein